MHRLPAHITNPHTPAIINWRGASGSVYGFQLDSIGTVYHDRPGVYIACKLAGNGNWDAVYIGETESFYQRLSANLVAHHKWRGIRAAGGTHFCTLHVPGGLAPCVRG